MFVQIAVSVATVLLGFVYKAIQPPPPKVCGSPGGPPVTSPRIKLSDGRHLSYREAGVSKDEAKHKIIVIHGFASSKDQRLPISQELAEELNLYFLFFDRAGYGESDPYPNRSVRSEAYDIQELADAMQLGSKFYVIGISLGAYPAYSCMKYIPHRHEFHIVLPPTIIGWWRRMQYAQCIKPNFKEHFMDSILIFNHINRLAGISLVVPFVNYWWPGFPCSRECFRGLCLQDQCTFGVARYAPWLFYWWMTQKWFPSLSLLSGDPSVFSRQDLEIMKNMPQTPQDKSRQQGDFESLHRDIMVGFGTWEFDILDLKNPFPGYEGSAHIWQGYEDKIIPFQMNRYISKKLPWIKYHEVPDGGHLFISDQSIVTTEKICQLPQNANNSPTCVSGQMFIQISVAFATVLLGCIYEAIKPPPPKICGSPGGPPVTSPRIKLSDGRHLSYKEAGVNKDEAKHKIIVIHGVGSSKDQSLPISQELVEELKLYFLFYDRAGYGESDPYPNRLAGIFLVVPFVNYWWPGFPCSGECFRGLRLQDQWTFRVAHYAPWLFYWWMTQKWFPSYSLMSGDPSNFG
uniref:AB hydrolase-1 domain-containing protein n=1 Tax=Chenopodium quinoa TaxID=63459 RepID=A0A803N262_CHEQI